ncbi:coatomer complex protein [Crassisporium funariophilum]|nr:coatomer complex protein [Crassisporium funariophilum]
MESSELYQVKQQFTFDYITRVLYQTRSYIALSQPKSAIELRTEDTENIAPKAVASFARYVDATDSLEGDAALELRDLAVEIDGEDVEGSKRDKALVRVLAGTAFACAGEIEEALETLGSDTENLEAVARVFDRSKRWAEDDLLLQFIGSTIGLVTGKDNYANTNSFYAEQRRNPSLSSPHLLTARGVTRIMRGEIQEANSDLEEPLDQQKGDVEAQAGFVVAGGLADELWSKLAVEHPSYPLVHDLNQKADMFDQFVYVVPPYANTISV